ARLRAHAGRTIRIAIDAPPLPGLPRAELVATIDSKGLLRPAEPDVEPAVTLHLRPSVDAAFELLREGAHGATRHVRVEGDAALATTVGDLARELRWDAEEDLSRVTGDVAAHRIGRLVEAALAQFRDIGSRARGAAERYVADDQKLLATRALARELADATRSLDQRLSALESRAGALRPSR
ncbi:MAG: hypothetical protein KJZ83_21865, partial [Burkholderiaceae bacterium]|nr:hypothetical protein [Burkholderiaceae bacterium]